MFLIFLGEKDGSQKVFFNNFKRQVVLPPRALLKQRGTPPPPPPTYILVWIKSYSQNFVNST